MTIVLTTLMQAMPEATFGLLPAGVHVLSAESQAALARAKARGEAIMVRHTKRARLAAADQPTGS